MLKSQLIHRLAQQFTQQSVHSVAEQVHCIVGAMINTLTNKGHIEIRGFGTFTLRYQAPRTAHNPKTGKQLTTNGRYRAHFKPGKALKHRVDR